MGKGNSTRYYIYTIIIDCCVVGSSGNRCKYFREVLLDKNWYMLEKPIRKCTKKRPHKDIENSYKIPEWCPLEEYKND